MKLSLLEYFKLTGKPLLLDGANGSLIEQLGGKIDKYLWSSLSNLTNPDIVCDVHKNYIKSGANIITTNTFRTNPAAYNKSGLNIIDYENFVKISVNLAKKSVLNNNVFIAGSNSPAEDCYKKERDLNSHQLEYNHKKHIELLWNNGVDFILNETQSHFDEISIICKFCHSAKIPYVISLYFNENLTILSGETLKEIIDYIMVYAPIAISFNCISSKIFKKVKPQLYADLLNGFYFNCGEDNSSNKIKCIVTEETYTKIAKKFINKNTMFLGACCGSNYKHIIKLRELIDESY
ncbi:MAG: homocysteine S-methyltransferase family protein [bacterium]